MSNKSEIIFPKIPSFLNDKNSLVRKNNININNTIKNGEIICKQFDNNILFGKNFLNDCKKILDRFLFFNPRIPPLTFPVHNNIFSNILNKSKNFSWNNK
jgi:hypothetical protein